MVGTAVPSPELLLDVASKVQEGTGDGLGRYQSSKSNKLQLVEKSPGTGGTTAAHCGSSWPEEAKESWNDFGLGREGS